MNVIGVGIDSLSIARIRSTLMRFGARFEARVFTEQERQAARLRKDAPRRFAMMFAAKEAAAKALGVGFRGASPKEFELVYLPSGAPQMQLHGRAWQHARRLGVARMLVSLSDDQGTAVALAIAVGPSKEENACKEQ